jgi:two-component system chemotaxis response regulator CheY
MTGAPSREAIEIAARLNAYEFLIKPFDVAEVVTIIHTCDRVATPLKVLVVDDSAAMRQLVGRVLQGSAFKCEITEATDGESALHLCGGDTFDVALLDCNMPDRDGLSTLKELRAVQPSLKMIMISAERDSGKVSAAFDGGACGFLHKPFYAEDIDRALYAAFGLRKPSLDVRESGRDTAVVLAGPAPQCTNC